ncbi:Heat shock protein beta6like [Caligus rogercresseyi]|uniref:Heat shock protein beta6like n=1 Tax=Caligus rogercresseyi TaxID=217165 RepID=A0A7T8JW91_CALRO|nr:Heat shock protein beta6like [Caligus rogercresseyi]
MSLSAFPKGPTRVFLKLLEGQLLLSHPIPHKSSLLLLLEVDVDGRSLRPASFAVS